MYYTVNLHLEFLKNFHSKISIAIAINSLLFIDEPCVFLYNNKNLIFVAEQSNFILNQHFLEYIVL